MCVCVCVCVCVCEREREREREKVSLWNQKSINNSELFIYCLFVHTLFIYWQSVQNDPCEKISIMTFPFRRELSGKLWSHSFKCLLPTGPFPKVRHSLLRNSQVLTLTYDWRLLSRPTLWLHSLLSPSLTRPDLTWEATPHASHKPLFI